MNPERPPKRWWEKTVRALRERSTVDDPEAVAGWLWYHAMKPEQREKILRIAEKEKENPGYDYHIEKAIEALMAARQADPDSHYYWYGLGSHDAHRTSAVAAIYEDIEKKGKEMKNPIAIYNPKESRPRITMFPEKKSGKLRPRSPFKGYQINEPVLIYDLCLEIRAQKNHHSEYKGEKFKHTFSKATHAQIFGLPDGSLLIKSKKDKPLWRSE